MKQKLLAALATVAVLVALVPAPAVAETAPGRVPPFTVDAKGAVLMDPMSGQILWEQKADAEVPPASLTKIVTMTLVEEAIRDKKFSLNDTVPVGTDAWAQNFPGSSLMWLEPGMKVPVSEMLKGIAISSGNDACVAMADFMAGGVPAFVGQMNERVKALGMSHTQFVDPHGLSPNNRTTAREMAAISATYIREFPASLQTLHSQVSYTFNKIPQFNKNSLLGNFPGADGLKTGFIDEAGYNIVGTAKRGNTRLLLVLLGTKSEAARGVAASQLLEWGFANFSTVQAAPAGTSFKTLRIWKGAAQEVGLTTPQPVFVTVPKGQEQQVQVRVESPDELTAPVSKAESVGTLVISAAGSEVRVKAYPTADVKSGSLWRRIVDSVRLLFRRLFTRKRPA